MNSEETRAAERLRAIQQELDEVAEQVGRLSRSVGRVSTVTHATPLVGMAEAAELAGRPKPTMRAYKTMGKLPNPVADLACGPVWLRSDIEQWARKQRNGRRTPK